VNNLAIYTDELTRQFKNILAVDHISLEIPRGAIFGFLGPNGAGKTTTIRLLLGLLEPTQGRGGSVGFRYAHTFR
jgi:ABC-type multidrug transport system ATPase subunit